LWPQTLELKPGASSPGSFFVRKWVSIGVTAHAKALRIEWFNDLPHPGLLPKEKETRSPSHAESPASALAQLASKQRGAWPPFPLLGERIKGEGER